MAPKTSSARTAHQRPNLRSSHGVDAPASPQDTRGKVHKTLMETLEPEMTGWQVLGLAIKLYVLFPVVVSLLAKHIVLPLLHLD